MKKGSMILGSFMLIGLSMYGAWSLYKKIDPECAEEVEDNMKKMTKKVEKKMEDMM